MMKDLYEIRDKRVVGMWLSCSEHLLTDEDKSNMFPGGRELMNKPLLASPQQ